MKKIIISGVLALGFSLFSTSCQKALDDIKPNGTSLSLEQVQKGATVDDVRAGAGLPGMYSQLNTREGVFAAQSDFGYPSLMVRLDHAGDNVVSVTSGYNWFSGELRLSDFQHKRSTSSQWAWISTYKNIKLANDIIGPFMAKKDDPTIAPVLGQALATRAWDYFLLAQLFGKTYFGNESTPCVPIIDENTTPEQIGNNPRKSVKEVYDFILKDLNLAVELLKGYTPAAKSGISEAVVYGIRARVHLVMNKWNEAQADADKAIQLFAGKPLSIAEVSIPTFDDVQNGKSTMWGIIITPEDPVTKSGISNYTSMFTSLCFGSGGYTTFVGTYKKINTRLWDQIPETDVRRGWWIYPHEVDGKTVYTSPLLSNAYKAPEVDFILYSSANYGYEPLAKYPYAVVKFAPNDKDIFSKVNAVDFQLMRVEEMYYIKAEAQAMGGNAAAGLATLTDFVKTYRDPGYSFNSASAKDIQEEIYFQRRVEFWGEGISWFDMLRLKKGIDRVDPATNNDGGYPTLCRWNVPAGDPTFTFQIPEIEEQNNKAIEGNNNPEYEAPKDIM